MGNVGSRRRPRPINRPTSLYLDLVRFTAAIAVFISHTSAQRVTAGFLWQAEPSGDEAVDVFFVLSGFVIAYVTSRGEADPSSFALARLARVYSVALPALATTVVLDGVGRWLRPDLYPAWWGYHAATDGVGTEFLASLFFVNHVWWLQIHPGLERGLLVAHIRSLVLRNLWSVYVGTLSRVGGFVPRVEASRTSSSCSRCGC